MGEHEAFALIALSELMGAMWDAGDLELDVQRFDPTPWKQETPEKRSLVQATLNWIMGR